MSALGQKQTCAVQKGMSALPPKADVDCHLATSELFPFSKMRSGRRCRSIIQPFFEISPGRLAEVSADCLRRSADRMNDRCGVRCQDLARRSVCYPPQSSSSAANIELISDRPRNPGRCPETRPLTRHIRDPVFSPIHPFSGSVHRLSSRQPPPSRDRV